MKQVYEVRVEIDVYVIAESEEEARREGLYAVKRGGEDSAFEVDAEPLGRRAARPKRPKGVMRSLPYNAPRERRHWTVEEWLSDSPPAEEQVDDRTLPMFPTMDQSSENPK